LSALAILQQLAYNSSIQFLTIKQFAMRKKH